MAMTTLAEQLQAPTGGFESAIVVPIINAQNFELKSSLINLVQNQIFRGDCLNSAAGGNFLYKSPNEGLQIIENKANVRCSRNAVMRVSTNAPPPSLLLHHLLWSFTFMAEALEYKMTLTLE
ncbi:hypothetical protein Tco_0185428 [Tanacetum coccineum]|uniref:Uncharacterized protein n=1 Tax=Tanacetum coccineum TaxID=301880 RepID=A0ABQ4WNI9_9ASTR